MTAPTILIVDDTAVNLRMLDGILRAEGFQTVEAADGSTARSLASRTQIDLILLDVLMPGENGFETCAQLKSDPRTADIPVIFLSALDDVENKVAGLKAGGVDYISKPVHTAEVMARVRVHLRIRETNRALVREQRARLESLREAQQAILVKPGEMPEANFGVYYQPLEEAGGDFYDVVSVGTHTYGYFVADVSGHGSSAAFLTSAIKALLGHYASPLYSPEDTMRGVDRVMRQMLGEEQYLTACYAQFNQRTRQLVVVSAGHPPLLAVRQNPSEAARVQVERVEMNSDPLGTFNTLVLQRRDLRLAPGDRFFLYSDGIIEDEAGGGRKAGIARLIEAIQLHCQAPIGTAVEAIVERVRAGLPAAQDDLLLLGVEAQMGLGAP